MINPPNIERRQFYRLVCHGTVELVTATELTERDQIESLFPSDPALDLHQRYSTLEREAAEFISSLNEAEYIQARFLRLMNDKLDLIPAASIAKPDQTARPKILIDLSEGGMAFASDKRYMVEGKFAIRLVLSPEAFVVYKWARVKSCEMIDPERYKTQFEFTASTTEDADDLLKFLVREQRRQLQQ